MTSNNTCILFHELGHRGFSQNKEAETKQRMGLHPPPPSTFLGIFIIDLYPKTFYQNIHKVYV